MWTWICIAGLTAIVAALRAHLSHMEEKYNQLEELYYQLILHNIGKKKEDE